MSLENQQNKRIKVNPDLRQVQIQLDLIQKQLRKKGRIKTKSKGLRSVQNQVKRETRV